MKWVFWVSLSVIIYAYVGYPLWLWLRRLWRTRPVMSAPIRTADLAKQVCATPFVSIVMAVHNEAGVLARKLRNLWEIDYPPDRCEIIVVSDGSTDQTNQLLAAVGAPLVGARPVAARFSDRTSGAATRAAPTDLGRLHVVTLPQRQGKASALNRGIQAAKGEIVVFTDARQLVEPEAVKHLVADFADPTVGCVSGELMLGEAEAPEAVRKMAALPPAVRKGSAFPAQQAQEETKNKALRLGCLPESRRLSVQQAAEPQQAAGSGRTHSFHSFAGSVKGVGVYWSMEKKIRQWESATGSVVGVTGALYAVRRELLVPLPPGTILDDVYLPLHVVRQGRRVIFEPRARAYDDLATGEREFRRKVRTLTGNYQLLHLAPWLLGRTNPVRFEFVCHKLLRLVIPFALASVLVSSMVLEGHFFRLALFLQLLFYGLAILATVRTSIGMLSRLANLSLAFVLLNTAAAVAFAYFVTGKKEIWAR